MKQCVFLFVLKTSRMVLHSSGQLILGVHVHRRRHRCSWQWYIC